MQVKMYPLWSTIFSYEHKKKKKEIFDCTEKFSSVLLFAIDNITKRYEYLFKAKFK